MIARHRNLLSHIIEKDLNCLLRYNWNDTCILKSNKPLELIKFIQGQKTRMRKIKIAGLVIVITGIILVTFAFVRTWNKTDIEFRIHINEKLIRESNFGEPPTFAIWIENPNTSAIQTIFVTRRAASGVWKEIPAATPVTQEHVANKDFLLTLYGPGQDSVRKSNHDKPVDDPFYIWSGECKGNWAVTLKSKTSFVDLTGLSKIRGDQDNRGSGTCISF
jgi:hypothetical protein